MAWVFLSFQFHLHPLSVFVVVLEVSDVDDVLGVSELALAVVLALEEGALIDEAIFFVAAGQDPLAVFDPIHYFSFVLFLSAFAVDAHHLLRA